MRQISKMAMAELRSCGKKLHIRGVTNYGKYTLATRGCLENEIRKKLQKDPEYIVLADKPLKYLRDEMRKLKCKISSDVSESMRDEMIAFLVKNNFVSSCKNLLDELVNVKKILRQRKQMLM